MHEKKPYIQPKMEVVELSTEPQLLCGSSVNPWLDDKREILCGNGHKPVGKWLFKWT